jgi:hypothetical protein
MMSIWAHVCGCIRIDGIPTLGHPFTVKHVESILGNTCTFHDDEAKWDACNTPMGSEGSLQYKTLEVDDGMPWIVVPVWGDLRSVESLDEIEAWWYRIMESGLSIRSAVLQCEIEGREQKILTEERQGVTDADSVHGGTS